MDAAHGYPRPPVPPDPPSSKPAPPSLRQGVGCGLFGMGLVFFGFGVAALLGVDVELIVFDAALEGRAGRVGWTVGSLVVAALGLVLLRRRGG